MMTFNPFRKPTMTETTIKNLKKFAKPAAKAIRRNMKPVKKAFKKADKGELVASGIMLGVLGATTIYGIVKGRYE